MSDSPRPLKHARLPDLWGPDEVPHTPEAWSSHRRPQLLELFRDHVYGRTPEGGGVANIRRISRDAAALDGLAERTEWTVTLTGPLGTRHVSLLLYVPREATASDPAPVFVGLNFNGNHSVSADAAIALSQAPMPEIAERGTDERRWPLSMILERGYAIATMHYCELEADLPGHASGGVRGLFHGEAELERPDSRSWGAIGAWAWGLSRILDVLETMPTVDAAAAIAHGHSRLGKAALWAAAQDQRFAAVVSNESGCAGASLFRHSAGETIAMITDAFPHWFAGGFRQFATDVDQLPVDQHLLLAAIAPRPVHVASATLDFHADPRGEYLSTLHASPIFSLFGGSGTLLTQLHVPGTDVLPCVVANLHEPAVGRRVGGRLSYHLRFGEHDVIADDWSHFLDFADENVLA
ncbi:acetylxylan esterase [Microbacterium kribbense]|uniref:Acetylxylan esterase n=1 Tax=Microbacterium kribbense TaxID=433645 RepID=A0ABP7GRW5_9MICO